jgi:hypothetical protein
MGGVIDNTLGTNIFGSNSSDKAMDAQANAAYLSNQTQKEMFDKQQENAKPWMDAGLGALSQLQDPNLLNNYQGDPGYQFRLDQGNNQINAAAAARGLGNSGATMKALTKYGQDFASNEYNNAYNRTYGRLSQIAGFGQGALTNTNAAAQNYGNNVAQTQQGLGNAQASNYLAQGNKQAGLLNTGLMAGIAFSDERLKTDIEEIPKDQLAEMKKFLKAYAFGYKDLTHGRGRWVGVMAQDLEKSELGRTLVIENEKGEKMIDLKKVLSMFLATMAEA